MTYEIVRNGPIQQHLIQLHEVDFVQAHAEIKDRPAFKKLELSKRLADQIAILAMIANVIELKASQPAENASQARNGNGASRN